MIILVWGLLSRWKCENQSTWNNRTDFRKKTFFRAGARGKVNKYPSSLLKMQLWEKPSRKARINETSVTQKGTLGVILIDSLIHWEVFSYEISNYVQVKFKKARKLIKIVHQSFVEVFQRKLIILHRSFIQILTDNWF